jgi:hypothetical protein
VDSDRLATLLTACASPLNPFGEDTVHLLNPVTGETAQCGPYTIASESEAVRSCVEEYKSRGFQRVP